MIDAEVRSEERFSRLSLAYENSEEKQKVEEAIQKYSKQTDMIPEIYTTKVASGKEVLVMEYHDDMTRESGEIFENIMHALNVTTCI